MIGGMGSITQAMAAAVREAGGEIRTSSPVAAIVVDDRRVRGVALEDGTELRARVVLSNADPKRTFLSLVEPSALPEEFRADVAAIKMAGPCAKVNFVLSAEPAWTGMPADADPNRAPSRRSSRRWTRPSGSTTATARARSRTRCGSTASRPPTSTTRWRRRGRT